MKLLGIRIRHPNFYPTMWITYPTLLNINCCCAITGRPPWSPTIFPGYYAVMAYLASHALCFDGIGLVLVPGLSGTNAGTIEEDSVGGNFGRGSACDEICYVQMCRNFEGC